MTKSVKPSVRAVFCSHESRDDQIYASLERAVSPLKQSWQKLEKAKKIVIKANITWPPERIARFKGRYRELVDPAVLTAVLKILKQRTNAELVVMDSSLTRDGRDAYYKYMLDRLDVKFVNANTEKVEWFDVPGGGLMFERYILPSELKSADAVVSIAKMKSHKFTGITLTAKNFFGWSPVEPYGRPRTYFHHPVRLPYSMADLGLITNPSLCIIDALVGQSGSEWNGEGRVANTLVAGEDWISTDACAASLMGTPPNLDWPTPPFRRERNHILVAAEKGYGTIDLSEIDFQSEVEAPIADFMSVSNDSPDILKSWRKTACEQALYYLDNRDKIAQEYAGSYIFLQRGKVVWTGDKIRGLGSRRELSGDHPEEALWLKYVDPNEFEGEHYEVYERELKAMK